MYVCTVVCVVTLTRMLDIGALQKEVGALEEMKSQLFLEYVDLHAVKVMYSQNHCDCLNQPRCS